MQLGELLEELLDGGRRELDSATPPVRRARLPTSTTRAIYVGAPTWPHTPALVAPRGPGRSSARATSRP